MKIVVFGSKGQLGKKISELSAQYNDFDFLFYDIQEIDITDNSQIDKLFIKNNIDLIINCAAYTAVDKAEEDVLTAEKINSLAPAYLAKKCSDNKAKFIHISTDYVFDGISTFPYKEDNPTNPQSVYGRTKLDGEIKVLQNNPNSIIIRTSWLYSEHGSNFVKTMLRLAKERTELRVVSDQIGSPTYAGDLADAIMLFVLKFFKQKEWYAGIYHYSNSGICSWYEFASEIIKISGIKIPIIPVSSNEFPSKVKRPAYSVMNTSKISEALNISIPDWKISLNKMMQNIL
ncbi:MAG TPA: dTDP-4-dehydrorhamnose reductase [Bacteroidales bacterium]|nr:dTDP-4-dehydrorhamnose reductase [Bacteroidales bacterium]